VKPFPLEMHAVIWCIRNAEGDCSVIVADAVMEQHMVWTKEAGTLLRPRMWFKAAYAC